ncbi:MAG: hypothetical protein KDJ73_02305 [Notoacmeibacter sp.]|nr:hypothetical protein [Notoacmeibacter sp.]
MAAGIVLAPAPAVRAAEIVPYENAQFACVVKLSGLIEAGDAERLATVINAMASDNPASPVSRVSDGLYKRSKLAVSFDPKKRICLDSPGGNLAEGIRLADMIYEVLGTAIEPGAQCLSACSIAFMAGSESTESDAGIIASRVMDATAKLGFHAPDLTVQEGSYNRDTVQGAFYVAVNSVGEILKRSGEFKFPYTLVGEMLRVRPQEFLYIDTVNRAARWHIDVANTVGPAEISPLAVSNACNNWYRFHADQVATNGLGDGSGTERWGWVQDFKPRKGEFSFSEEGFGQEGATKCHVIGELKNDGDLSGSIRIGENEIGTSLSKWIVYDQAVRLEDLALSRNPSPFRPVGDEGAPASTPGTLTGGCLVVKGDVLEDFEPCTRVTETTTSQSIVKTEVHAHIWPSGGKTVVVEKTGSGIFEQTINGVETNSDAVSGKAMEFCRDGASKFGVDCLSSKAACYPNATTGKLFCFVPGRG